MTGQERKNSHPHHIELLYKGIGDDLMAVNSATADGFMKAGDMRYDIIVTQRRSDRVVEYDQLGNVRIGRRLEIPRKNNEEKLVVVTKADNTWNISINDQLLADEVLREEKKDKKFDEAFVNRFEENVVDGLKNVLFREKIMNGDNINLTVVLNSLNTIFINGMYLPAFLGYEMVNDATKIPLGITLIAAFNALHNITNSFVIIENQLHYKLQEWIFGRTVPSNLDKLTTNNFNDPSIKSTFLDYMMPPTPVDRVIRGRRYLNNHKDEILEKK